MVLRKEITSLIKDLLKKNPTGLSITEIVKTTGINRNTAGRYLENLLVSGQVEMRRFGMAKIYRISERVPLSAVLSISSELVLQLDNNLRIVFINEPFLDLLGTEEKMILGKNIEYTPVNSVFDESFPQLLEKIQEGLNGKEASGDFFLPLKDLIFYFRIAPTVFEDGRKGVSVILEDISERRRADNALRESEDRYRKLVEISPDAVLLHQDGKIIYANPATFRLLGASHSGEIIGKNVFDFIADRFKGIVERNIQKDLEGQPSPRVELSMIRVDGTSIIVEGSGIGTKIDGKSAVQVALRDITEQKRAEEALKIKERQLFSIYSNVPDVMFSLSIEPDNRFRFLTVNQSFLDMTHMSEDQVVGKYVHEVIPDPLFSRAREKYNQAIREKKTIQWEEVQDNPNGKGYGDCYITAVFDEDGHPTNIIGSVHDSTKHKQLEEMLRESEGKLNAMLQSIPDPMSMMDENLTILWANEPAKRSFGEDIIGKKCYEAYHLRHDPCEPYPCFTLKAFSDGKIHQHETTIIDNRGEHRFFECSANVALRDDSGKPVAVLEISRDVTDRKKAEADLRESDLRLRLILDNTDDLIILQDPEGRYLYFNSAVRYGVSAEQARGLTPYDFIDKNSADRIVERVKTVIKTGQSMQEETQVIWNNQKLWFSDSLSPVRDANGAITAVVTVSQNITERKHADIILRESEEKYRTLVDCANDVICVIQDGVVKLCNPRITEFWGGAIEEILGRPFTDIVHPDTLSEVIERHNRRIAGESPPSKFETILMRKDGTKSYVEVNVATIFYDGKIADLVITRDINERKKAEEALRESEATARALINAPTDSVILIDDKGTVLAINEIAASRFGKRSKDLVGTMSYNLLPKDIAQLRRELMAPVLEKKESVRFVDERAGRWYDTVAYPILDEAGNVKKIAIIARDITEQKIIEKQLRASEQLYQRLLEQSFDAVAIHKDHKIAYLNRRAVEILGAGSPEELIGRPIFDLIHPDSRRDLEERLQNLSSVQSNPVPVLTEKFFRVNGTTVTVEVMAIRFDDNGSPAIKVAFREIVPHADRSCGSDGKDSLI